jgi:hypothetical protein
MDSVLNQKINERFDDFLINIINYFSNQNILEKINNKIIRSNSEMDKPFIKKKSALATIQQILIHMEIIKPSYRLTRDDLMGIIVLIETKLSMESLILYMGYFLSNSDSCETNDKTDQQLLSQLNNLMINRFYTNDVEFFKTILINQYFINKQKFCLHFSLDKLDYDLDNMLSTIETMLRELISIPIKKHDEVKIINNTILNDGINRYDVYKIKSISVDNLLDYNNTYNGLNDELTDIENKKIQNYEYFFEKDKPFVCNGNQLKTLISSKQKKEGGNPKSKKKLKKNGIVVNTSNQKKSARGGGIHNCTPEFEEIPDYFTLKHDFEEAEYYNPLGYRNGWEIKSVTVPEDLLKKQYEDKKKPQSWSQYFKKKLIGIVEDEYKDRAYFTNKNMCQRTTTYPPSNLDIDEDEDDDEQDVRNPTTRSEAIHFGTEFLVYKLYKDDSVIFSLYSKADEVKRTADNALAELIKTTSIQSEETSSATLEAARTTAAMASERARVLKAALDEVVDCNKRLDKIWYYQTDLLPVKIPINPEYNKFERRTIFSYPLKHVNNHIILENRESISDEFLHSGIPILWFYKIFKEYIGDMQIPEEFKQIDNIFQHKIYDLLILLKRYILFNNSFNEETLSFFISLGAMMYTTTNLSKHGIIQKGYIFKEYKPISDIPLNNYPYYLFDEEFYFNDIIKDMIKNNNSKYLPFLNEKIPYIFNSHNLLNKLDYKIEDNEEKIMNWENTLAIIALLALTGIPTMITIASGFQNFFNSGNHNFLVNKQNELINETNDIKNKLYFNDAIVEELRGVPRPIESSKQLEYGLLQHNLYVAQNQLNQITHRIQTIASTLLMRKQELLEQRYSIRNIEIYDPSIVDDKQKQREARIPKRAQLRKLTHEINNINKQLKIIVPQETELHRDLGDYYDFMHFCVNVETYSRAGIIIKSQNVSHVVSNYGHLSIPQHMNNSNIINGIVDMALNKGLSTRLNINSTGTVAQIFVYLHGVEPPSGFGLGTVSNLTHFNYIVVETDKVPILDLNQQHGTVALSGMADAKLPKQLLFNSSITPLEGLTAVPNFVYMTGDTDPINAPSKDRLDGIWLNLYNKNTGAFQEVQLVNNTDIAKILQKQIRMGNPFITAPELVQILRGIRQGLGIQPQNTHFAIHSCQGFANETLYQDIPELSSIKINDKNTFFPVEIHSRLPETVVANKSVHDLSRESFKPGEVISVKHQVRITDSTPVKYKIRLTTDWNSYYVAMNFRSWLNFNREVKSRINFWQRMSPIQQYYAMMVYKHSKLEEVGQKDFNDAPKELQKSLGNARFLLQELNSEESRIYEPQNWDKLVSGKKIIKPKSDPVVDSYNKKWKGGEGDNSKSFDDIPLFTQEVDYDEITKLSDYFDSKLTVSLTDLSNSENICDKYIFILKKLIQQSLIVLKEYIFDDVKIFYNYINHYIAYIEEDLYRLFRFQLDKINELSDKIKNKFKKLKEIDLDYLYHPNLIKIFTKYQSGDKIEENEYEYIIKNVWAKHIFINDLSLTNSEEDLLNQIKHIDSIEGTLVVKTDQPILDTTNPENYTYKCMFSDSLLFKLPNYEQHIQVNGNKYIKDIISNYSDYFNFKELYLKYFENIKIQIEQLSNNLPETKKKDIKNLINVELTEIKKKTEIKFSKSITLRSIFNEYDIFDLYINKYFDKLNDNMYDFDIKYKALSNDTFISILYDELYDDLKNNNL